MSLGAQQVFGNEHIGAEDWRTGGAGQAQGFAAIMAGRATVAVSRQWPSKRVRCLEIGTASAEEQNRPSDQAAITAQRAAVQGS